MAKIIFLISCFFTASLAQAQEQQQGLKGESELGSTITSGNNETNTLSAKTENKYAFGSELLNISGRYHRNTDSQIETARSWDFNLRYERFIAENLSAFLGHKVESDPYAGYVQRDSTDLGLRYNFINTDDFYWLGEGGYRYTKTLENGVEAFENFGRLYTEVKKTVSKTSSAKLWLEYLPNFTSPYRYLANAEASLSVSVTEILLLKIAYLAKYQNEPLPTYERTDTIFTTTLVAKY